MLRQPLLVVTCLLLIVHSTLSATAGGEYVVVDYPASEEPGELQIPVTYTLWVPDGVERLRGVVVHQHGCGVGACRGGETSAYDLHWQALAKKWDCALLGPSYHQAEGQNCRLWCDPRNGSAERFLQGLHDLAVKSGHPEVEQVPWCLWGHSGGGFWSSLMLTRFPERIAAIWLRSGTAYGYWTSGEIEAPDVPAAAYGVPIVGNPGQKEKGDERFHVSWDGLSAMFADFRAHGSPFCFAPDPRTAHECGDSRYLAIPFFDACLARRLPAPDAADQTLRPVDDAGVWLATTTGEMLQPAAEYGGTPSEAVWLIDEPFAHKWEEYIQTGAVDDSTPPPAPTKVSAQARDGGGVVVTWDAEADFESGLRGFRIERDGEQVGLVPSEPVGRFGRPLFQRMSYHDTPEQPLPRMEFVDENAGADACTYQVISINSVGLESDPAKVRYKPGAP